MANSLARIIGVAMSFVVVYAIVALVLMFGFLPILALTTMLACLLVVPLAYVKRALGSDAHIYEAEAEAKLLPADKLHQLFRQVRAGTGRRRVWQSLLRPFN